MYGTYYTGSEAETDLTPNQTLPNREHRHLHSQPTNNSQIDNWFVWCCRCVID